MEYKEAQKAARLQTAKVAHDSKTMGTLDLGIKEFKRLGKTKTEIKKFKEWAWSSR